MKLLVQLLLFAIALLLTIIALLFWFVLIVDGMDFILANFPEEELLVTWITLGFTFLSPIISIIIYFMLWKTNFFTRNNS
tara:strand:- start:196 stop:435 length:240 start_codon:yes stop_codon:yes gene_type:complete